jgi:hypothetical protein
MTQADTNALILKILGDVQTDIKELRQDVTDLKVAGARTETKDNLEDSYEDRKTQAKRWTIGILITMFFSGLGSILSVAHVVFHIG